MSLALFLFSPPLLTLSPSLFLLLFYFIPHISPSSSSSQLNLPSISISIEATYKNMVSIGGDIANQAMWLYPKNLGFIPPERWGHSACQSHGLVYIYGGCCGGLHYSDVLMLNVNTMSWSVLATKGKGPGSRDSHSAVLWGNKMVIFGGTDGSKKLNDLHVLDLGSSEWMQPHCAGNPPSPRESHTATLVGDDKLVVFGGSGEGVGNYLNDLHLLDLKSMAWSPIDGLAKGDAPSPRDSHTAVAVGDELLVFGGDSGDHYHGDVHRLDTKTMTWMKFAVRGSSPGARAGHAAVTIGHKIYVIGGVGDNKYYNDAWILDTVASSWSKLDVYGLSPQGRFSHTAVVVGYDIVIYGGCGEDEHPLREFLLLRLRDHIPTDGLGNHHPIHEMKRSVQRYENRLKMLRLGDGNEAKTTIDTLELQSDLEEHSHSQSQSDQEQTTVRTPPPKPLPSRAFPFIFPPSHSPKDKSSNIDTSIEKTAAFCHQINLPTTEERSIHEKPHPSLIGAEVKGKVDGAFDSGYLMTAIINGRVFRGVLFAPVPNVVHRRRGSALQQNLTPVKSVVEDPEMGFGPGLEPLTNSGSEVGGGRGTMAQPTSSFREVTSVKREAMRRRREFEGVVLSLGVPGNGR